MLLLTGSVPLPARQMTTLHHQQYCALTIQDRCIGPGPASARSWKALQGTQNPRYYNSNDCRRMGNSSDQSGLTTAPQCITYHRLDPYPVRPGLQGEDSS